MTGLNDPDKALEEMYKAMSDEDLKIVIDRLFLRQQRLLLDSWDRKIFHKNALDGLIQSQNTITLIISILLNRRDKIE
jgi:hypothetical protein